MLAYTPGSSSEHTLNSHLAVLAQQTQLTPQVGYSLVCIAQALAPNNSQKLSHLAIVSPHRDKFLRLASNSRGTSQQNLLNLMRVINILEGEKPLEKEEEMMVLDAVGSVNVGKGQLSNQLCDQLKFFCARKGRRGLNSQLLLKHITGKMMGKQMQSFLQTLPSHQLEQTPLDDLICLAKQYPSEPVILKQVMQAVHWWASNRFTQQSDANLAKKAASFLADISISNIKNIDIVCLCSLTYRELRNKAGQLLSDILDNFFKGNLESPIPPAYLSSLQKNITQEDLKQIIQVNVDISSNHSYQYLLNHYAQTHFPWSQSFQNYQTKKHLQKEFLLRINEIINSSSRKCISLEKEEVAYAAWLPVSCMRTVQGLMRKVEISGPFEAMETVSVIQKMNRNHPRFQELLIMLVQKAVQHRNFESLRQVERVVLREVDSKTVVERLQQKSSVHKKDSNRQSKKYFALVPLLLTKTQAELEVGEQLGNIFGFETFSVRLKLYVADFLLRKMIEKPLGKFVAVLTRLLQSDQRQDTLNALLWYLKGLENLNKATLEWVATHFSESGQRLLELVFSMLLSPAAQSAAKVLFRLQKLGVYNCSWLHVYRWVTLAIEEPTTDSLTLDYLQLFEMLLEKVGEALPKSVAEQFERALLKNWSRYTHEHFFAIKRIVELLNHSTLINFKKIPIPNLSDLLRDQQLYESSSNKRFNEIDPITRFLNGLSWNLVFQQVDSTTAIKNILSLFTNIQEKGVTYGARAVSALQILLYVFQDGENIVETDVDNFVGSLIGTVDISNSASEEGSWWKVWGLCLQYLSRVPHSLNILKLPLTTLLKRGFNDPKWISSITDLLEIVLESKPKALGIFKLQQVLKSILSRLIALEGPPVEEYLDLLDVLCSQEGEYQTWLSKNLILFERILVAEGQGVGYRPSLIRYALQTLIDYDYDLMTETIWMLFNKYACDSVIVLSLLEYLESKGLKGSLDQQLLTRLVLTHTQHEEIQQKCRTLFNTHAPPSNIEKLFMTSFAEGNYCQCEQLLPKIGNPFSLTFSLPQVKGVLEWKQAGSSTKKLLHFLSDHPDAYLKMHSCEALYLNHEYIPYLTQTLQTLKSDPSLQKFLTNPPSLTLKSLPVSKAIFQTLTNIIKSKSTSQYFKTYLISTFQSTEDAIGVLTDLMAIVMRDQMGCQNNASVQLLYQFCRQIVGQWELMSLEKVNRYNLRQLIYLFPYKLSDLNAEKLLDSGILNHYLSLMQHHRIIKNQITFEKYLQKVRKALILRADGSVKDTFVTNYMKIHLYLQNKNQWTFEKTQAQPQATHLIFLSKLQETVDQYLQIKMSDPSTKLQSTLLFGYIATTLHGVSMGLQLNPPSIERLSVLEQNYENYGITEENKTIIKDALKWLLKNKGNSGAQSKTTSPSPSRISPQKQIQLVKEAQYQSVKYENKNKLTQPQTSAITEKKEDYGLLSLYASMRPSASLDKNQAELKKEAEESYIRYKQTEQRITIRETQIQSNTTLIILDNPAPAVDIDEPSVLDQKVVEQIRVDMPSSKERQNNLDLAKKITQGQFSIQSLKDHCKFIASISELTSISSSQISQLLFSLESIRETVDSHTFYVKKVADNETIFKLIKIYKTLVREKGQYKSIGIRTLKLCLAMAEKKQKKMVLFNDEESVHFFKMIVKRALNKEDCTEEITLLLGVFYFCRYNTENYFKNGLFSMVVELANRDIVADQVIDYLIRIELSTQLINQIYQRGLFNKLMQVVSVDPKNQQERTLLNLWVKLAGKVCINKAIQQRFRSKDLHSRVWTLFKDSINPAELLNLCYFYAYLCIKNEAVCEWLMQNRVLEQLLNSLKAQIINEELYLLFYHFCFGNSVSRDYCFRFKYHLYLLERLSQPPPQHLTKYFFKSLGQMMGSRLHVPVFFKEEAVTKLINLYSQKSEPAVYECLLDFISTLQTEAEYEELKRQRFWESLKLFEYKVSNEATYSYLLQTFLVMIKKGRTKEFNQPEVRSKVCLKSQYSINMEGKELALRFILALSIKNKQNYLNERCIKILGSVMGLKVSQSELQLTSDMLKIEGTTKNPQLLNSFTTHNIHNLIIDALHNLPQDTVPLAMSVLNTLCINFQNAKSICGKGLHLVLKSLENVSNPAIVKESLKLLSSFAANKENQERFTENRISSILKTSTLLSSIKTNQLHSEYSELLGKLTSNGILLQDDSQQIMRIADISGVKVNKSKFESSTETQEKQAGRVERASESLRQGIKVKMYKTDGSVSQLLLFISSDLLQLNCATKLSEVVKQKWRLPINQIINSITFQGQQSKDFLNSLFQKNSGFFTKTPGYECCLVLEGKNNTFFICFASGSDREEWTSNLTIIRQNVKTMLNKLKQH